MTVDIQKLEQDLTGEEGRKNTIYKDSRGLWSGGIGRLLDPSKGGGFSDDEVDLMFSNDVTKHTAGLYKALPWIAKLSEPRQRALCNMAFQMGVEGVLHFPDMLRCLEAGEWQAAVSAARDSAWATETPERCDLVTSLFLCNT